MPLKSFAQLVILTSFVALAGPSVGLSGDLSPGLEKAASISSYGHDTDSLVEVLIFLDDHEVKNSAFKLTQAADMNRGERIKSVVRQLKSYEAPNKQGILNYLSAHAKSPMVEHWIVPAVSVTLPLSKIESLADLDGVKLVVEDASLTYEPPVSTTPALSTSTAAVSAQLNLLGIPDLWQKGLKGKGRLVCSFDTGVDQDHPALADKWRGNSASLASSWFSTVSPNTDPVDPVGHGTHTMGIMVGAAEADSFGVAPEAEWITAGVVDQGKTLSLTISDILLAYQWALNPDGDDSTTDDVPDVILNSWGIPLGLFNPCDDTFWGIIDYVEAAGIVTIFSAGNEGPDPQTMRNPADRATSPINSFAVGAVDNNKVIESFSSRGPSSCDETEIKPEVVVPGVDIRSCAVGGGYSLMTGTSMAAPYVAGLVALVRQYNPDATVEQIKYAFLQAAEDLGTVGEDNAYGHGFLNASRVLEFIPAPVQEDLALVRHFISDDGIAQPGETFGLQLVISSATGDLGPITGTISAGGLNGVQVTSAIAEFTFGSDGTTAVNEVPFQISFDSNLFNGQEIDLNLMVSSLTQGFFDTLSYVLTVGIEPKGEIASHNNGRITLSVSDFGQFGFAPGSVYNVAGDGLSVGGSDNLLYEAGVVVGVDASHYATSIRDELGQFKTSDFTPTKPLTDQWTGEDGGVYRTASYTDAFGTVPVTVNQETVHYDDFEDEGLFLIKYTLSNHSLERMTDLRFGFFADLDLGGVDRIEIDPAEGLLYQTDGSGLYLGVVTLSGQLSFTVMDNGTTKTGFTSDQLTNLLSSESFSTGEEAVGDKMFMVASDPLLVDQQQSAEIALALVAGNSLAELYDNADRARTKYENLTNLAGQGSGSLPDDIRLYQNYPNPFNPATNISFSVLNAGEVSLDVINVLGQRVRTLFSGYLSIGLHKFEWDGTDQSGSRVASGVYFYRLEGDSSSQSRKMLLLK